MELVNTNQTSRKRESTWISLGEYSPGEFELTGGLLLRTIRNLGVPPESLAKIEKTLAEFANEIVGFRPDKLQPSLVIRLFCQEKIIAAGSLSETSVQLSEGQALELSPTIHQTEMNAGWGYFLIERARSSPAPAAESRQQFVDLYLYKEGQ